MTKRSKNIRVIGVILLHIICIGAAFFTIFVPFDEKFTLLASGFVFIVFLPSGYSFIHWLGLKKGFLILSILGVLAVMIETVALRTGLPYGRFIYTQKAGVIFLNNVPVVVPFAWCTILLGSYALTSRLTTLWKKIGSTILYVVVIDLILDPIAVSLGLWLWEKPGWYYEVPITNFLGWIVTAFIGASFLCISTREFFKKTIPQTLLISLYISLIFWLSIAFFKRLTIPFIIGLLLLLINHEKIREGYKKILYG